MDVHESIKRLRADRDLTQVELGKIAGVSSFAVSQWENGRAVPRMGAIQRMADHFGVPKSQIMGDSPSVVYASVSLPGPGEEDLIKSYRSCSPKGKQMIVEYAAMVAERHPAEPAE